MKKILFYVMLLFMTVAVPVTLVSCGDELEEMGGGGSGDTPPADLEHSVTSVTAQKQCLEKTAIELMNNIDASDFESIVNMADYLTEEIEDGSELEEWAKAAMSLCKLSSEEEITRNLFKASNFYGEFSLKNGKWELDSKNVDCLKFNFNDEAGKACCLQISHSGKETKVHHSAFDTEYYDWWYGFEEYMYYENTFMIPENIQVNLTQKGSSLVSVNVKTSIKISDGAEFDYTKDVASITTTTKIKSYEIVLDKFNYSEGKKASISAKFNKSGRTLMTASLDAVGDITDEENLYGSVTNVSFGMLDNVKIAGKIQDINKLEKYLEKADENDDNEETYKNCITSANELIDLGLYFYGKRTSYVELYPFEEEDWYDTYWACEPIIKFADGSGHATLAEYFDEMFFDSVIRKFQSLLNDFDTLVDE